MTNNEVLERYRALRELTLQENVITKRAQHQLISSLPDAQLIELVSDLRRVAKETESRNALPNTFRK